MLTGCGTTLPGPLAPAVPPAAVDPGAVAPGTTLPFPAGPLHATPFHPQELHQCGPAALATVLGHSGVDTDPDALADRVYVPGRRGSFQAELIAATRAAGRIPYAVDGSLEAVAAEITTGRPVLVLQNLALRSLPHWHYAVVIGVDARTVTLRSGRRAALRMSHRAFLRTWRHAGHWGFVVLRPGEWPARPEPRRWLAAMSDQEQLGQATLAAEGYAAAVQRWPEQPLAWFALGNAHYRQERLQDARAAYARAAALDPAFAAAWNNLAQVLGEVGCRADAHEAIARGKAVADPGQLRALESTEAGLAPRGQPASSTASACSSASGSP